MQIGFKHLCIMIAIVIALILFSSFLCLIVLPSPKEIIESLRSSEMMFSLKLTLISALISTILVMIVGTPAAYALARFSFPGKKIIMTILDLPIAMPEVVLGLALLLLFGKTPLGTFLKYLGIRVVFTKIGVVVAEFFTALPYAMRTLYSTFETISARYELVARSLGYGAFETFMKITLPMARSGIIAALVIAFARSVGTFGTVLILAGGTYMVTETLPVTLYLNMSYGNLGMAITSGLLLLGVSFITIYMVERLGGRT
ncbi:MAG: ABC transporter permease subunit [Crenarchaeota archaeon]|nr:ABC transporter permease subunit [Thermoproteota archaeon]